MISKKKVATKRLFRVLLLLESRSMGGEKVSFFLSSSFSSLFFFSFSSLSLFSYPAVDGSSLTPYAIKPAQAETQTASISLEGEFFIVRERGRVCSEVERMPKR